MAITLQFNVKPGDTFRFRSTFTTKRGGKTSVTTVDGGYRIVAVTPAGIHVAQFADGDDFVTVYDRRGYPIDVLHEGRSIKDDVASEMFDISNSVIFPDGPVSPGDTWEAVDGVVRVSHRLVGTRSIEGREVAEIQSSQSSYSGPIQHSVELATGWLWRTQYLVGQPDDGTTTVIERV